VRVSQGITRLNPLCDAPAKTVNINNSQNAMLFADGLPCESSIPELKRRLRVVWHSIGQSTGLPVSLSEISPRHRGSPISADSSLHPEQNSPFNSCLAQQNFILQRIIKMLLNNPRVLTHNIPDRACRINQFQHNFLKLVSDLEFSPQTQSLEVVVFHKQT
jgi:hypothetical protein